MITKKLNDFVQKCLPNLHQKYSSYQYENISLKYKLS
jgi:hypothetical protein